MLGGEKPRARTALIALAATALFASASFANPAVTTVTVECNWGKLTMEQTLDGFSTGEHSSDPSGDGRGAGSVDEPRAGLANVVERGNLQGMCELIESLL